LVADKKAQGQVTPLDLILTELNSIKDVSLQHDGNS